jgi:hypothetical protein
MITETFFLMEIPHPIRTLSFRDHDAPAGSRTKVAAAHVGDKGIPLGGAKRQDGAGDILAVAHVNALPKWRGYFDALTGPVRSRALSPITARALNILIDLATTHHTLLDSVSCLRYLFQR